MEAIKDLRFIEALLPLALIIFIICVGVVFLNLHFQRNLSMQKLKQEALKTEYQQELLRVQIQAQEEERKRIAHDLHDELGAVLSIMRMHLMVLEQQPEGTTGNWQENILNIRHLSETAMASIRSISHRLMPPQLESFGLLAALESVTEQLNNTGEIQITLNSYSSLDELPWLVNLGLFRIIMELINNTLKHAAATTVNISFTEQQPYLICHYQDNGKGLPLTGTGKGLGHKSMEGRVNVLSGKLNMGNNPEGGFYATIEIDVNKCRYD